MSLLEVRDLHMYYATRDAVVRAVDGISFDLERGQALGIVGESAPGRPASPWPSCACFLETPRGIEAR